MPHPHRPRLVSDFRFLSIGECMVELAPSAINSAFQMGFAGDTYNTAWYMRQLRPEAGSRYFTKVGQDAVSDNMLASMQEAGIDTAHICRSPDRSVGLYLISLKDGERSFSYWRDTSAARQLVEDPDRLRTALEGVGLVYFSGVTMAILDEAGRAALLGILAEARAAGTTVAFDSNLRPRLWASADAMRSAIMAAAGHSDIVLPSYDDEAEHFGDADPEASAERYRGAGATTVVVKNGAGTIHYNHDGSVGQVTPPPVTLVVDTTAAGDSFNAGFFAGLDRSGTMEDLILSASAVARQVIGQKGGLVPVSGQIGK